MVLGIVCEYNPFHNGHAYQLAAARAAAGEGGALVCVQSGDFVQRGEAAVYTKFARAEAACRCGADLVVELPLPWCLSSAEGFARGAVGLLGALGIEALCFGSESADLDSIEALAALVSEPDFLAAVKERQRRDGTLSFAAARQREAQARLGEAAALLSRPNDILAVEYAKAIQTLAPDLRLLPIRRRGAEHDGADGAEGFFPASYLRRALGEGGLPAGSVPEAAAAVNAREREQGRELADPARLEIAWLSRLRERREEDFLALPDAGDGLGARLYRAVREGATLDEILALAATKRYPTARLRRALLCACLGVTAGMAEGIPPYARVLAMNERGRALLHDLPEDGPLPLLTKPAAVQKLPERAQSLFALGAAAHDVYTLGYTDPKQRSPGRDWRTGPYRDF